MENKEQSLFEQLYAIDVSDYTETKKSGATELTYLSWAWAWKTFKEQRPNADYKIVHFDGRPYLYDENLGYMVETQVTDGFEWKSMWLPVMDDKNKAMKDKPYTYQVKKYGDDKKWHGEYEDKEVKAATMFDINTALMRCFVKNIGMFGLGLCIYAGEDVPDGETVKQGSKARFTKPTVEDIIKGIEEKMTVDNAKAFYAKAIGFYGKGTPEYNLWVKIWADKKDLLEKEGVNEDLAEDAEYLNNM
jgi:hypothetical protein